MPQSQYLTDFYRAYLAWVEGGCEGRVFANYTGLCSNLFHYLKKIQAGREIRHEVLYELQQQFTDAGMGDTSTPFNDVNSSYAVESMSGKCHLNKARLAWVRNHVQQEG